MTPHRVLTLAVTLAAASLDAQTPQDAHRRLFALGDVRLESGVVLPNATLAYATFGTFNARATTPCCCRRGTARTITATTS